MAVLFEKESDLFSYIIFGAGRMGKALAYFLAKFYNAKQIALVDIDNKKSAKATMELKKLLGPECKTAFLNAAIEDYDKSAVKLISRFDVLISALPHRFNLELTKLAIRAGTHYCDYGFDEEIVLSQLALNEAAKEKGVCVIPNCGVEPGLSDIVAVGGAKKWNADEVKIYIGGIATKPENAFRYAKLFSGLFHEYVGKTVIVENGEIKEVETLGGYELVGVADNETDHEAFFTRMPFGPTAEALKEAGVKNAFSKTIRLKGHHQVLMALKELGLLELTDSFFEKNIPEAERDILFFQIVFKKEGKLVQKIEMVVRDDRESGLSAMQIATSSVVAVIAKMLAEKKFLPGARLPHEAADFEEVLRELLKMKIAPIMTLEQFLTEEKSG